MKRAEEKILQALAEQFSELQNIEITASGLVMIADINITAYQAAKILKRIADEIVKDPYWNHNVYKISMETLLEAMTE